jgi:putative membrane protein
MRRVAGLASLLLLAMAAPAGAHGGAAHALPAGSLAWDVATALMLVAAAGVYLVGWARLRPGAGAPGPGVALAYLAGLGAVAIALLSPIDDWSDVHFSAHMGQHELLVLFAAPLVVAGRPERVLRAGLPGRARRSVAAVLHRPGVAGALRLAGNRWLAAALHGAVVWLWHLPVLFEAALHDETIHAVQHLSFFATAALFWWAMVRGRYGRLGYGVAVVFVFLTCLHKGLLGALFAFAGRAVYPTHAARTEQAGGEALLDQELAGLLMWVPAGALTAALGVALFAAWLGALERRAASRTAAGQSALR